MVIVFLEIIIFATLAIVLFICWCIARVRVRAAEESDRLRPPNSSAWSSTTGRANHIEAKEVVVSGSPHQPSQKVIPKNESPPEVCSAGSNGAVSIEGATAVSESRKEVAYDSNLQRGKSFPPSKPRRRSVWADRPQLICWLSGQAWQLGVEIANTEEYVVSQSDIALEAATGNDTRVPLSCLDSAISVRSATCSYQIDISAPLLFKIPASANDCGFYISKPSRGLHLVVVPSNWQRHSTLSAAARIAPQSIGIPGYLAHFFVLEQDDLQHIAFVDEQGGAVVIETSSNTYELVGKFLVDDFEQERGSFFIGDIPRLSAGGEAQWSNVSQITTIVWPCDGKSNEPLLVRNLVPEAGANLQSLRVDEIDAGLVIIHLQGSDGRQIDSIEFRYCRWLNRVNYPEVQALPGVEGHQIATFVIQHESGSRMNIIGDEGISVEIKETETIIHLHPETDIVECYAENSGRESPAFVLGVERIWWALAESGKEPLSWSANSITVDKSALRATSKLDIVIRLPRPKWAKRVFLYLQGQSERSYPIKIAESIVRVALRDFSDAEVLQFLGSYPLFLKVEQSETSRECEIGRVEVTARCAHCDFRSSSKNLLASHLATTHFSKLFATLSESELSKAKKTIPAAVFQCSGCGIQIVSNDRENPASALKLHVKRSCPTPPSQSPHREIQTGTALLERLKRTVRCLECSEEFEDFIPELLADHYISAHPAKSYNLVL